ncbi:hypothetical protein DYI37_11360 [Fulvimarina endophytica]|uniref:Uncharacterized protein n=1 Tax=Fulvimarina endophytica TaxID=2293836 RepID=A0A371X308_9HYPH|nr:phage GP46 family protein [Fulvimarina endophytica]RFC63596.1 hypothetical protein DYI37_11360 [Fulvimarina endophytica]
MFLDIALRYDPQTRNCDLALGADMDLVIDETPATPMLLSVYLDRRAEPDDVLPQGRSPFLSPDTLNERRGSAGDALDPAGQLAGSHLWLHERDKQTEETRLLYAWRLAECLAWAGRELGSEAEIEVDWLRPNVLGWRAFIDGTTLSGSARFA